jgi:peptide/nickel transport system permease protein
MSTETNKNINVQGNNEQNTPKALSDESRVKVMSPAMLVFKRFIRNRLAVIGFIILAFMFLLSFVGPLSSPYEEAEQFWEKKEVYAVFAGYKESNDYSFYNYAGANVDLVTQYGVLPYIPAMTTDDLELASVKDANGNSYFVHKYNNNVYELQSQTPVAVYERSTADTFTRTSETPMEDAFYAWMKTCVMTGALGTQTYTHIAEDGYTYVSDKYIITETANTDVVTYPNLKSTITVASLQKQCIVTKLVFHDAAVGNVNAITENEKAEIIYRYCTNQAGMVGMYSLGSISANGEMEITKNGQIFAMLSGYTVNSQYEGEIIPIGQKKQIAAECTAIYKKGEQSGIVEITLDDGSTVSYKLDLVTDSVKGDTVAFKISNMVERNRLMTSFAPSSEHILGTDQNGMDVMTRIMYGGRVSLMVGFVVVAIEILIGVIMGGIAGYFSGWVDVIIMRFIELFNCIPFYPMMMIIGSVMDHTDIGGTARIFLLMALLGILGWPGIARIVRGQILSLREQDFMVATEACGIPVRRRIFKHLIPNVIPLLIVNATMSLGGIIITEATLSFLNLGIKYPSASWGLIINQAEDAHVITSYPWIWIPAGILILLTVLGFNFVGDGLRDAFDPKMKR